MILPVSCPGPLVWFPIGDGERAVLECSTRGYIETTGGFLDEVHACTPLMSEGLAT